MHVEQFVMAYGVEQDRLRAILPEGFSSLRPVLRINAEIRDEKTGYLEFNTAVQKGDLRGWLNIGFWDDVPFAREGKTIRFCADFLEIEFTGVGIAGGCPAEKDNASCFFLHPAERLVLPERITASKEFCDCRFRWRFTPEDAHGVSLGKTLPAVPSDVQTVYPKEPFTARNAANIPCTQVLGTYMVKGVYMAADHTDINPNNTKLSAYTAYVGNTVNECEEYVWRRMETFRRTCGEPTGPMMRSTFRTLHEADKQRMAAEFLQKMHWDQRLPQIDFDDPG